MQSSKREILAYLKRSGATSVDALAQALGLSPVTIRQHLATLQRDDLVEAFPVRRPTGRPHYEYQLTSGGEDTFPRRYDRLAEMILQQIGELDAEELDGLGPAERISLVIRRLSQRLALHYAPQVQNRPLEERVAAATAILHADGGFAEWEKSERGFEIRDYNCVFSRLPTTNGTGCEWHLNFLRRLLGSEVRYEPVEGCVECCRYIIEVGAG